MTLRTLFFACFATIFVACAGGETTDKDTDTDPVATDTETGEPDTCPDLVSPAPTEPGCEPDTLTCIQGATTTQALQACFDNDANGQDCLLCINQEIFNCATENGRCSDEFGEVECCLQDECPSGDPACVEAGGACAQPFNAFNQCVQGAGCTYSNYCFTASVETDEETDAETDPETDM